MEVGRAILADHPLFSFAPDSSCRSRRPRCEYCNWPTWDSRDAAVQFCTTNGDCRSATTVQSLLADNERRFIAGGGSSVSGA